MKGQKTFDQVREELKDDKSEAEDLTKHKFKLDPELFKDFAEVVKDNEDEFKWLASWMIIRYLEENAKREQNLALEFPELLDSKARALIHGIADFLGIRAVSLGAKKNRRILVFPRTMFKQAWVKEEAKQEKEKEKLRQKYKDMKFQGEPEPNPINTRDKWVRELYFEQKGIPDPLKEEPWEGPLEVRIQELKRKNDIFVSNMKKLSERFALSQASEEAITNDDEIPSSSGKKRTQPNVINYVGNSTTEEEESKSTDRGKLQKLVNEQDGTVIASNVDLDEEELLASMSESERQAYKDKQERIKKEKMEEFKKVEEYHKQLKETSLKSFKDRPDQVKEVWCNWAESTKLGIEWKAPASNNSPIKEYHVYVSDWTVQAGISVEDFKNPEALPDKKTYTRAGSTTELEYTINGLKQSCGYRVFVTAENDLGEGYKLENAQLIMTLPFDLEAQASSLYVWGNNRNAELGITDEQAVKAKDTYSKHALRKPTLCESFENGSVVQVAAGNCQTIFIYVDSSEQDPILL